MNLQKFLGDTVYYLLIAIMCNLVIYIAWLTYETAYFIGSVG